jgi:hypothetical protein
MKRCVLLLPILALAACGSSQKEAIYVSRSDTGTIPVVSGVSPQQGFTYTEAVMTLPEAAGSITNVRERNFSNGTRQEIILSADKSTHGENVIDVSVATGPSKEGETGELQIGKPSERGVRNEILARFPDVRMGIVTRAMRNAYGPFGLAIGKHSDGARCIFAWQWIDDVRDVSSGQSGFSRFGSLLSRRVSPVSIRIRLCRGDQTVDQMAGLIEGLRLGEASALDRILAMDRRNIESSSSALVVDASKSRGDVAPLPESLEAAISAPAAKPAAVARQSAPRPARVAARPTPKPRVARRRAPPTEETIAPAAPAIATPSIPQQPLAQPALPAGPRYLAPIGGQSGALPMGVSAANIAPARARLDPGLPAQAYRGPSAQTQTQPNAQGYGGAGR